MTFTSGHHGSPDRVGGQPGHGPVDKPWPPELDYYYGFVMQLSVDGQRLRVPGVIAIQLFQPIDDGDNPTPKIILIPSVGTGNAAQDVVVHPLAQELDIGFEMIEEPDEVPNSLPTVESLAIFKSKLGGLDPWENDTGGRKFLGQIKESQVDLNFAGLNCGLYLETSGLVVAKLR